MPLHIQRGDIFTTSAEVLVVPVNCVGVAGKGLALAFRERYPVWFQLYQACCRAGELRIGRPLLHWTDPLIISFPTKEHWRLPSHLSYIEQGLTGLAALVVRRQVQSLAVPKLGCGEGQLLWSDVMPLLHHALSALPCEVFIYV